MAGLGRKQWKLQEFAAHDANVNSVALGRKSGRVLVTGGDDKKVNLWAVGKPNCIMALDGHTTPVECVRFSSTEELVCAGSLSGAIKVWDLEAAKIIRTLTGHKANIRFVDFHPYGDLLVSGSLDSNIKLWDIRRKGCVITYKGHSSSVNGVKFSPDGQWIASGGDDAIVKLWDLRSGKLLKELLGHKGPVSCVEFHPNEFLLGSGSNDRRVVFWDLESFKMVSMTEADCGPIKCIYFENAGRCLYAGSQDTLKVYGWEPARTHDTLLLNWGKVHDISCAQNQLIGASFHSSVVSIYVVDWSSRGEDATARAIPAISNSHSRRSFDHNSRFLANRDSLALVKRSEDSDPMTTDPEDELGPELFIASESDYEAIFQPRSRELRRTPPPFEPPVAGDASPPPPPTTAKPVSSPRVSRESARGRNGISGTSPTLPAPANPRPSQASSHSIRSRSESRLEFRRRRSPPSENDRSSAIHDPSYSNVDANPGNEKAPEKSSSKWTNASVPSSLTNDALGMRHSPSESSIAQLTGGLMWASVGQPGLTCLGRFKRSSTADPVATKPVYPVEAVSQPDKRVAINADHAYNLDIEDFLPKKLSSMNLNLAPGASILAAADLSEAEVISHLVKGHNPVLGILQNRRKNLMLVNSTWNSKDVKGAMQVASSLDDMPTMVDFFGSLNLKASSWTLDLCVVALPVLLELLDTKYENYMLVACDSIKLIVKNFSSVIKTNVGTPYQTVGVDISREERHKKCLECYQSLVSIRSSVMKKQTLSGNLGRTFRDLLHLLVTYLD